MNRRSVAIGLTGLGALLVGNPLYLSFIFERTGIGYMSSPWLTGAGVVYLALGVVLVGISHTVTTLRVWEAVAVSLVSLPAIWVFVLVTDASRVAVWVPRLVPLALMFPFGIATGRKKIALIAVTLTILSLMPLQLAQSPTGWNGPVALFGWFVILVVWTGIVGSPIYLVSRSIQPEGPP